MTRLASSLLLASVLLAACDRDDPPIEVDDLDTSRGHWESLRDRRGGTYAYRRSSTSWTGFGSTTHFVVRDNRVVERSYTAKDESGRTYESWTESGTALGSHAQGAPIRTVDQLYDQCADEVLTVDPDDNTITLTFGDDGILDTCVYVPDGCADDCAVGVSFELEAAPLR